MKIKNLKFKIINYQGFSLLEILVVVTIFAILGILVTQSVILTLQGSKKSESLVHARENLDYSLSIIERQIRGASSITSQCSTPPATPSPATEIDYLDQDGVQSSFTCVDTGSNDSYIASGSASTRLTSDAVKITECSFTCTASSGSNPPVVAINLTVQDASASVTQKSSVSASTQIYLRTY